MNYNYLNGLTVAKFQIYLRADSELFLPGYKGAAFRGGFGQVFKSIVCPMHETFCIHSSRGEPCVYDEVFNTPIPSGSAVMRKYPYVPHPFVLTPPLDRRTHFAAGEMLNLELALVGKAIPRLAYFIHTLEELGRRGLGPRRSRYRIVAVQSLKRHPGTPEYIAVYNGTTRKVVGAPHVFQGSDFQAGSAGTRTATLSLLTPSRIISGEHLAFQLPFNTLLRALLRRIGLLAYFHCGRGADVSLIRSLIERAGSIRTIRSTLHWRDWSRFSTRQHTSMKLGGLVGEVTYEGHLTAFLPALRAGELVHVGKGTSFGLGKYVLRAA